MKKIVLLAASLMVSPCFAAYPGFYVGAAAGVSNTHYSADDIQGVTSANIDNTGFAGRVDFGYQWNENWAAELGYTRYSDADFNHINNMRIDGKITENATDLVAKVLIPFNCKLGVYGKAGVAYVDAETKGNLLSRDKTVFCPTYGIGFGYDINPNVPIEILWSRVQQTNGIENADLFSLGIAYHFG